MNIPEQQEALQLIGPDELELNRTKEIVMPGPDQVLGKVECTNICFSDLKLLKQFSEHPRKSDIVAGVTKEALAENPSYVPNEQPTVPGHETVVNIVAAGENVTSVEVGKRYLVQADFRWLKTEQSNGAFGYNIEGGLQEYVLLDERVFVSPEGESMLISAPDDLSASSISLVEPWACVEDSYVVSDRQKPLGELLLVVSAGSDASQVRIDLKTLNVEKVTEVTATDIAGIAKKSVNDIVFVGTDVELVTIAFSCLANGGLINIVQCGGTFGGLVDVPVGRVHYGGIRITGTVSDSALAGYAAIPDSGEIREGDTVNIIGAGGPMGFMHVVRNVCQGVPGVTVCAGELDKERLDALSKVAEPLAEKNGVSYKPYDPIASPISAGVDYSTIMVPIPALVADAVTAAADHGIINIFAGIMAQIEHPIDIDMYVSKKLYFIGTSGSMLEDMLIVLRKVIARTLDTDLSIAAIAGLDGAVEGIRATENRTIPGKITVYPQCKGLGLVLLDDLAETHADVAACLRDGFWTKEAEDMLLGKY